VLNVPAYGFGGGNHKDITYDAARTFANLRVEDVNIFMYGNWSQDDIRTFHDGQERHFTSSFFDDGYQYIQSEWQLINQTNDRVTALLAFGRILHDVQDFYAHSNWVELHEDESPIPTWDLQTTGGGLWSGYWPNNDSSFARISGTPNHAGSNKDNADSPAGSRKVRSGPNEGKTYFELAKEVATRASAEQMKTFLPILAHKPGFRMDEVLRWPINGKAYFFSGNYYLRYLIQPDTINADKPVGYIREGWPGLWSDGIDAAVVIETPPNPTDPISYLHRVKAFFFKGSEFIRYDVLDDKADPGYPTSISMEWRGLWPSGVDAALNWGNDRIFFFKGDEYVRFDTDSFKVHSGYPRKISAGWPGLWRDGVDAAINWGNGKAYFFKGDQYIRWDISSDRIDAGF
jgi:matrix metalloproteinase-14 (membrane-inserted)